ncbi:sugar transporter, putative [Talaromyces marneffei ATCC 18224]|uniref:Sugar transporter, putative n=1 Tax=Talaromyces marneffei (strain ATCC 18224 / CBS 334.59 / QM 7333) TaxID=441960 RepID=B6QAJ1_TALMQ|nr:sugar transporter, putative [Talaromyces marneffei ATCC 18224]
MSSNTSVWSAVRAEWRAIGICLFITIGAIQFGFDSSYYSGILAMEPFIEAYGHYDSSIGTYIMSSSIQSLTTSIINVGELIGAVSSYIVGDHLGRRGGLFVSSFMVVLGVIFQTASHYLGMLIVGRLLLGYAVGLISCLVPLYVADCAPARFRGALVSMYQFNVGIGLLLGVIVDNATKDRNDSGSYRIPMAVQLIFPIVLVPGLVFLTPESPRWLLTKGRVEEARVSLQRLHGNRPELIEEDIEYIVRTIEEEQRHDSSWRELLTWGPEGRKAYIGMALQAWQQASGINFITGYAVLLIVGGCGMAPTKSLALDRTIVAMVFVFIIVFNLSLGPAVWVVTSEISTGHNRNKLMASSTAANWFCSWLVTFTFPYLFNSDGANLGARVGFIYAGLMAAAAVWIFVFLPETSGRSLEEIQALFAGHVPARKFKSYVIPGAVQSADMEDEKTSQVVQVEQP